MGTKICMNTSCGAKVSSTWKKGWELKSGQPADLCLNCGSVYEKLAYCDTFHVEETGWRECSLCNKRLHCGCSASLTLIEIQDFGGIWCINCARNSGCHPIQREGLPSAAPKPNTYSFGEQHNSQSSKKLDGNSLDDARLLRLGIPADSIYFGLQMEIKNPIEFACKGFQSLSQPPIEPIKFAKPNDDRPNIGVRDAQEPQILPSLSISLGTPSDSPSFSLALPGGVEEEEKIRPPLVQPMHRPRQIFPKPARANMPKSSESNKGPPSQKRIARPPAEARLRSQLLPRYWPRITDQELQKLSGDLNSTIVPLFEKVLSASDASRIGRLVLPKACAEAYFPHINHSEGLPLKVQDVKGNEWTFQFRFWPNNNSRMYVLEGVTPCIQSMQLQAGDTVTFSRIDPGGKLVIGSRKASNTIETQDKQIAAPHDGVVSEDNFHFEGNESQPTVNGWGNLNILTEQSNMLNGETVWSKNGGFKGKMSEDFLQHPAISSDKKKARNIGLKNKRLLIHSEDALELRITWEETQDLLRPPPRDQPNVVMIEEFEFEEYSEPPVFGKRTLFTTGLLGGKNQWAQCDKCAKWRKLPWDALLPPTWSCLDNVWDLSRSSCSVPEEISSKEMDLFKVGRDSKKRKITEGSDVAQGCEPSGLDALANAAVLDDHARDSAEPSSCATTRHPRHRPGCTCIVCIQPPSGKGKHKSNCTCNVCSTVKRRFKTLMMRKKKRQGEREAEMPQQKTQDDQELHHPTEEPAFNIPPVPPEDTLKKEESIQIVVVQGGESSGKGTLDLNCRPTRDEDMHLDSPAGMDMPNLVQTPTTLLQICMNHRSDQNGPENLLFDKPEPSSIPSLVQPEHGPEPEPEPENVLFVTAMENDDKDQGGQKQPLSD